MNKKLFGAELAGTVFVSVLGTLAHFFYEWSGYSRIVALFCSVNESTWEHLKLLFFPYLLWSFAEMILLKKDIIGAKLVGVLLGMGTVVSLFYTYTGVFGKNIDIVNIGSFFVGVLVAFLTSYLLIKHGKLQSKKARIISIAGFALLALLFFVFTFAPPFLPIFRDPVSLSYGI